MRDIPETIRHQVIAELYRRCDELDWTALTLVERTRLYDQWLDDPDIGEMLTRHVPRERARRWVKDVPMKEYARARAGLGRYAKYVTLRLAGPQEVARRAFGEPWRVVSGSVREKPNRCVLSDAGQRMTMLWGPATGFRDLLWAALNARLDTGYPARIVVTTTRGQRLTDTDRSRHGALGALAEVPVAHIVVPLVKTAPETELET